MSKPRSAQGLPRKQMQAILSSTQKHEQAVHNRHIEGEEVFVASGEDQVDFASAVSISPPLT